MNLPNKITFSRIILTIFILILLVFPFEEAGIRMPQLFVSEMIVVDIKYPIAGVLFIIAALTDMIDGKLARKTNQVTDLGKMLDAIADKVLVNTILVALSASGFVHPIIPIVVIFRDEVVNSIKMVSGNKGKVVAASKMGKYKTVCMMTGIALTLFYNLPFELWNLKVSDMLLVVAMVLSVISGIQYYVNSKEIISK